MISSARPRIVSSARRWWRDIAARKGRLAATRALFRGLWEFVRNSTPERLRQRYGDADYDWDHRVHTTSAAVGWGDRLLGVFHSPYQPTEEALFHAMLDSLQTATGLDFRDYTFLDLGSGKGRTLLMASDYPFRRIVGIELLPTLHRLAQENLRRYTSESQKCFALEVVCGDATTWPISEDPLVMYLFNPFPEAGLGRVVANLESSLRAHPRTVYVLYHNPLLANLLEENGILRRIGGTEQYAIFRGE